jgi:hypothetical protein
MSATGISNRPFSTTFTPPLTRCSGVAVCTRRTATSRSFVRWSGFGSILPPTAAASLRRRLDDPWLSRNPERWEARTEARQAREARAERNRTEPNLNTSPYCPFLRNPTTLRHLPPSFANFADFCSTPDLSCNRGLEQKLAKSAKTEPNRAGPNRTEPNTSPNCPFLRTAARLPHPPPPFANFADFCSTPDLACNRGLERESRSTRRRSDRARGWGVLAQAGRVEGGIRDGPLPESAVECFAGGLSLDGGT